jgi:hypothetical protein
VTTEGASSRVFLKNFKEKIDQHQGSERNAIPFYRRAPRSGSTWKGRGAEHLTSAKPSSLSGGRHEVALRDSGGDSLQAEFSSGIRALLIFVTVAVVSGLVLIAAEQRPALSQSVKLVTVDVNIVGQGYRISKLTGSSVTNEKNEKIGTIDDFVVARNRSLFAVLQVGGFLGMGGHLVAVPYESLVIDDEGRAVQLPGASKDELKKLPEIKYRG